jgi:serine/threonine protein kinase
MADASSTWIGKYEIIELLGEGAMGVVYKARDSVLDRTVAIKVMNESIAKQEDARKRFLREAQAAGSLQHPNVVTIHDLGELDGHLFIAMEFIQGVDLQRLIELGEPLSLQAKLNIIIDVLTGLGSAHQHGIIHRDIKPANIRVGDDGRAKIMDFGVAHLTSARITTVGRVMGTPSYMAPEQITEAICSPGTDIFSVGAVLYQLLASMVPFDAPILENLLFKIVTESPRPVSELVPGLPPALDHIVQKAMAKEPQQRYSNTLDMVNDLTSVRSRLSGPSYPASASLSTSVADAMEQSRKSSRPHTRKFAFMGGGAIAAVALIAIAWSRYPHSNSPNQDFVEKLQEAATPTSPQSVPTGGISATKKTDSPPSVSQRADLQDQSSAILRYALSGGTAKTVSKPVSPALGVERDPSAAAPEPRGTTGKETEPTSVATPPVAQPPTQVTAAPPPPPSAADIAPAVEAYARAIESRSIAAIRRVSPGLTSSGQRSFEQLFQAARSINVALRVAGVEASGASADARVVGNYEYITAEGRTERQPVSLAATFRHDGTAWRLISVR